MNLCCKKYCRSVLIICLLALSQHAFSQLSEPYIVRNNISNCLNVRADHDANSSVVACIAAGTPVTVTDAFPFWRQVTFGNNQTGWVAKKFIEPAAAVTDTGAVSIPPDAFLTVHFVDVGQGDAIWIQTYDDGIDGNGKFEGYSIVIDGGPYSADNSNPLLPYMESQGYHGADIEALIVSHPHIDHFSGAETIVRHFSVNNYYDPGYPSTLSSYKAFIDEIKGSGGIAPKAKHVHIGQENFGELNWGKELKAEILYSWQGDALHTLGSGNTLVNNSSIVLRLQYGNEVFLFMGDAEGKERDEDPSAHYIEQVLLQTVPGKLKANVLKIAHHGSETSGSLPFISAVNPDIVIVESGRKSFGGTYLPDITTLKRYCANNPAVRIYRTDQDDARTARTATEAVDGDNIIIRTNGSNMQVEAFENGHPFTGNFCNE